MKRIVLGVLSIFALLFVSGCAMNKSLHIPASKGDLEAVKIEIESGKDINAKDAAGQTALMYASDSGQVEVVKYLIENGADPNIRSGQYGWGTALIYASASNRIDVMEYLIDNGADINATSPALEETPLMWAAARGHEDAVKLLLTHKADVTLKNKKDQTARDIASETNRSEIVDLLDGL